MDRQTDGQNIIAKQFFFLSVYVHEKAKTSSKRKTNTDSTASHTGGSTSAQPPKKQKNITSFFQKKD
jgi:hypothetical protein